jgi:hypothetical protein
MCPRCHSNGAYGYVRHHVCYPVTSDVKILAGIDAQRVLLGCYVGQGKSVVRGDSQRGFDSQVRQKLRGDNVGFGFAR